MPEIARAQSLPDVNLGAPSAEGSAASSMSSREDLLRGVQSSSESMLHILQASPESPVTAALTESLLQAATQELERMVDPMASRLSDLTGRPPLQLRLDLLRSVIEEGRSYDVEAARQHLTRGVSAAAADLNHVVDQMSPQEAHALLASLLQSTGHDAAVNAVPFEKKVHDVRRTYGIEAANDLRPHDQIQPHVDRLTNYLLPGLAEAFRKFRMDPSQYCEDCRETLERAAIVLVDHGVDTPEKANAFLTQARRHDDKVAFGAGALGQMGYGIGMAGFAYGAASKIAPFIFGEGPPGFREALAFGACAGAMVGYLDCVAGSAAGGLKGALSYAGSGHSTSAAAQAMHLSEGKDIGIRTGLAAATTFAKNALTRLVVPTVVYATAFPKGIVPDVRDGIDFAGDAGGALISGGINEVLKGHVLDNRQSRDFKLLAQANLPQIVQRHLGQGPGATQLTKDALLEYAKGAATGLVAPSTFAVTGLVITPLVGALIGLNGVVVPSMFAATTAANAAAAASGGGSTTAAAAGPALITAGQHAFKAMNSTLLMAVLAGGATAMGNAVGRHADGCCLTASRDAILLAATHLRQAQARGDDIELAERGAASGMRRRMPPAGAST